MTTAATDTYVTALDADQIFSDTSYQRELDHHRARRMAADWNPRLVGVLEVSDRGDSHTPRYAVIDGMHRWAAAQHLDTPPPLVANVHAGLTIAEEAALFDKLNRQRKQTNTWDHWRARRAAGDTAVLSIEDVVRRNGLTPDMSPCDGRIAGVGAMEKVVKLGGLELLHSTLSLISEIWGGQRDSLEASLVHGVALVLWYLEDSVTLKRLGDALLDAPPRQIKSNASALADIATGSTPVRTAIAIVALYNRLPGRRILVSERTFSGARREAQ